MPGNGTTLVVNHVPTRQLSALKRKASRLGVTPQGYIRQLIADDLELDRVARITSLDKLAAPFRKALKGLSEDALDRIVDRARTEHHKRTARRKQR
jgi:hypothetical protein